MKRKYKHRDSRGKFTKNPGRGLLIVGLGFWIWCLGFAGAEWFMDKVNEMYVEAEAPELPNLASLEALATTAQLKGEALAEYPCMYEDMVQLIICYSILNGANTDISLAIAKAESGYRNIPNYKYTGENGGFTAYGPFQIIKGTFQLYKCAGDRRNIHDNINCATRIIAKGDLYHWKASAHEHKYK